MSVEEYFSLSVIVQWRKLYAAKYSDISLSNSRCYKYCEVQLPNHGSQRDLEEESANKPTKLGLKIKPNSL